MADDNDKTIRLDSEDDDKTIRINSDGGNENQEDDKTIRMDDNGDKTTRINNEIISAEGDDKTTRIDNDVISADADEEVDDDKTVRYDNDVISADEGGVKSSPGAIKQTPKKDTKPKPKEEKKEFKGIEKFTLNKGEYDNLKILSTESGEASIYLVEKEGERFVLKLYFHDIKPKLLLLEKIKDLNTEGIIRVYDYGITYIGGEERFYELMEFAEGGTLDQYQPIQDPKKIKSIIAKTAEALNDLHKNGIIHKDIKPSNIFLRKKNTDQYILGDFGISSLFDDEMAKVITTQNRTETFAPPEIYLSSRDHLVEITPSVDWYALGISILFLWQGFDPFRDISIVQIPSAKMKCKLDFPENMPDDIVTFVKGCAVPIYEERWGYDEIKRWLNGENVLVNLQSATSLEYKPFVFDPGRNLSAETPEELAKLLQDEPEIGRKYLYRGKITKWLEESNNTKLAVFIEDIYEKEYPSNEDAGLKAAIYLLDESLPFRGLGNKICNTEEEFAKLFLDNFDHYMEALSSPDEDFYIYLRARRFHNKVKEYLTIYEKYSKMYALYNIIYSMDPSAPFRFTAKKPDGKWYIITTEDAFELGEYFAKYPDYIKDFFFYGYVQLWLERREEVEGLSDKELERILELKNWSDSIMREYKDNKDVGIKLASYVFYPEQGFLSQDGETKLFTREEIGNEILGYGNHYIDELKNKNSDIYLFLKANIWNDVIDYAEYCFNIENHLDKLGPYNVDIAWLKVVYFLGINIAYTKDDDWFDNPDELLNASSSIRKKLKEDVEDVDSILMAWLSVYHQESLETDKDKTEYAYEEKLLELFHYIGKLNTGADLTKKYEKAKKAVPKRIRKEKAKDRRFTITKLLAIILPIISGAGLFMYVMTEKPDYFNGQFWNVDFNYYFIFALIFTVLYAVTRGFGEGWDFSAGCLGAPIIGTILAVVTFYAMKFTVGNPYVFGGLLAVILLAGLYKIFRAKYSDKETRKEIFNTDDKYALEYEPLAFALDDEEEEFTSQKLQVLEQYSEARKFARRDLLKWGFVPTALFLGILALFVTMDNSYNKYLSAFDGITDKITSFIPSFSGTPEMTGMWEGKFGNTNMLMDVVEQNENILKANLSILYNNQQHFSITGLIDSTGEGVTLNDNRGGTYTGKFDVNSMTIAGIHTASGGKKTDFNLRIKKSEPVEEQPVEEKGETPKETPAKKDAAPVNKIEEEPVIEESTSGTDAAKIAALQQSKAMEELDKQLTEDEANAESQPETQPEVKQQKEVTPPPPPQVEEKPVATEEPKEVKPTHPDAIKSITESGYLASVVECRKITSTRMRITFRFTNLEDERSITLPAGNITIKDDRGNTYTPDIRILGNRQEDAKGGDLKERVGKGESVDAGLILNKVDGNARNLREISMRMFTSGWNVFVWKDVKIK
ncbi:MAG: hypothetical protein SCALA702_26120 [Melioribacteraceae bacterium]|nr:MAG: hypothetical protein SCALA702_26120 [Melioribacteraceae bacterium]